MIYCEKCNENIVDSITFQKKTSKFRWPHIFSEEVCFSFFLSFFYILSLSLFHHWEIGIFLLEQKGIGEEKQSFTFVITKKPQVFFLAIWVRG